MLKTFTFIGLFIFMTVLFAQTNIPIYSEARAYELKKGYETPSATNGIVLSKWQAKKLFNMLHDRVFWEEDLAPCFEADKSVIFYDSLHREVMRAVISTNCNAVLSRPSQFNNGRTTMRMSDLGEQEITTWIAENFSKLRPVAPKDIKKITYTVKKGDTWNKLATTYHTTPEILYAFNNGTAGQGPYENDKLIIYDGVTVCSYPIPKPATTTPTKSTTTTSKSTFHTVQAKETLYSISRLYGITVPQLQSLNGLKDNKISIGQVLKVK